MGNANNQAMVGDINLAMLSPEAFRNIVEYGDVQMEQSVKDMLDIRLNTMISEHAIAAHCHVAAMAAQAAQMMPWEAKRIEELVELSHRRAKAIVTGEYRRKERK